jgi:pyruvate,water dikinase
MLGWRGVRRSIENPAIFKCELSAIKRLQEEGLNNIAVMLPFVSKVYEVKKARQIMNEAGVNAKLGVMVETPAAALQIEDLCKEGIDFATIGSNNLTQLTLGLDRENPKVAGLYSETDPAVMDLIKYIIKICSKYKVTTSISGQAGSNPTVAEMLIGLGINSISVEPDAVDEIRKTAARTERRMLLEKLRTE